MVAYRLTRRIGGCDLVRLGIRDMEVDMWHRLYDTPLQFNSILGDSVVQYCAGLGITACHQLRRTTWHVPRDFPDLFVQHYAFESSKIFSVSRSHRS
jgi:hypothetical protein